MRYFVACLVLFATFAMPARAESTAQEIDQKLIIFAHALDRIRTSYVEKVTETEVIENAINGMLTALDPHSAYLTEKDFKDLQQTTRGEFGGLGIEVTMENGLVKVVSPIEDTPADKAGIMAQDLIIKIDGTDVQGMTLSDAVDRMRGKPGTTIKLIILREEEKRTFPVTLTRAIIKVKPIKSRLMDDNIGYIRVASFNDYTDDSLQAHLKDLIKENKGELGGLILDLRNNPGGLLNQAIAVADEFLNRGEVVSTRGRIPGQNARYNARAGDIMNGKPMVVLINGGSASAAEIVAGALQDHKRAVLVGQKSFGKGSVQTIFNLPGNAGMRLTTALYYTPSGRSIQAEGIVPDIEAKPLPNPRVTELEEDDYSSEASLRGVLRASKEASELNHAPEKRADIPPELYAPVELKDPSSTLAGLDGKPDAQLDRAMDIMRALINWPKHQAFLQGK